MKALIRRFFANGFRPLKVGRVEGVLLRILFALVVLFSLTDHQPYSYSKNPIPSGIAKILPKDTLGGIFGSDRPDGKVAKEKGEAFGITFLRPVAIWSYRLAPAHKWVMGLSILFLLGYISGKGLPIWLTLVTAIHILVRTHANSQGFNHHGVQIVSLTLLAQAIVAWWWFLKGRKSESGMGLNGAMLFYSQGVIGGVYLICVLSKLIGSKLLWVYNSRYIAAPIIKTHRQKYYEYMDPQYQTDPVWATWMLENPNLTSLLLGAGLLLEAAAIVVLKGRFWALFLGVTLIAMHRSIYVIMALQFQLNELLLFVFFINIPFWMVWTGRKVKNGLSPA